MAEANRTLTPSVFIACDYLWIGGAERVTVQLACELVRLGCRVHLHAFLGSSGSLQADLPKDSSLLSVGGSEDTYESMGEAGVAFAALEPSTIIVNHSSAGLAFALAKRSEVDRIVVFVHAPLDREEFAAKRWEHIDKFLCVSRGLVDWLLGLGVPEDRIAYWPNMVDESVFKPLPEVTRRRRRQRIGVTDDELLVGWCGRISNEKAPHLLVKAVHAARLSNAPTARLMLIGGDFDAAASGPALSGYAETTGGEYERVAAAVDDMERDGLPGVLATGPTHRPQDHLQLCDVFALSSSMEAMPLAALEAMACGLPVMLPDVGDCSELVRRAGAGWWYEMESEGPPRRLTKCVEIAWGMFAAGQLWPLSDAARREVERRWSLDLEKQGRLDLLLGDSPEPIVLHSLVLPKDRGDARIAAELDPCVAAIYPEWANSPLRGPESPEPSPAPPVPLPQDSGTPQGAPRPSEGALGVEPKPREARLALRRLRPKVAVVYDQPGWALHRIALQIERYLSDEFDVVPVPYWPPSFASIDCDAVVILPYNGAEYIVGAGGAPGSGEGEEEHGPALRVPKDAKVITCCYDHHLWTQDGGRFQWRMYNAVERADLVLGSSPGIVSLLRGVFPKVEVGRCYDGVDAGHFQPMPWTAEPGVLRVGWAGNSDETYHGDLKGVAMIREAVASLPYARLVTADRYTEAVAYDLMPRWYASIDVQVCMSSHEGTPNPILEASACGRPWVSTDVGIVGELRETARESEGVAWPGVLLKERTPTALAGALNSLWLGHRGSLSDIGRVGRDSIERAWTWEERVGQFRAALRGVLG